LLLRIQVLFAIFLCLSDLQRPQVGDMPTCVYRFSRLYRRKSAKTTTCGRRKSENLKISKNCPGLVATMLHASARALAKDPSPPRAQGEDVASELDAACFPC